MPERILPRHSTYIDSLLRRVAVRAPAWSVFSKKKTAYEIVRVLFAAIQKAGSLNPEAIRAALAGIELKDSILPGGVLKFTKPGQAVLPFVVTQNKPDGKVDIVWPKEARTGEAVAS